MNRLYAILSTSVISSLTLISFVLLETPNVFARESLNQRQNIINKELDTLSDMFLNVDSPISKESNIKKLNRQNINCVSSQLSDGEISWSEVCYTSSEKQSDSREMIIAKTMDQVVEEHRQLADQMTQEPVSDRQRLHQNHARNLESPKDSQTFINEQQAIDFSPGVPENYKSSQKHHVDVGYETYYYRYDEDIPIYIRGPMHGYYMNYYYRPSEGGFLNNQIVNVYRVEGRYARGDLDYKGSGTDNGRTNKMFEMRALVGKDYTFYGKYLATPYMGFGYRYLIDRGGGRLTSTNHYGYNRESHYFYIPIGVYMDFAEFRGWTIGMNVEYDHFVKGIQKSRLSDGDQFNGLGNDDLRNTQEDGYGIRGSVNFRKQFSHVNIFIEPFVRFWSVDRSDFQTAKVDGIVSDTWHEPANTTTEVGSKFGLQF